MNPAQFFARFQRIKWLQPSVIALLLANLVPLVALFVFHWDVFSLLFLFWLENVIIGILNVFKMILAGVGAKDLPPYGALIFGGLKLFLIPFFCVHYGIFTFGHGMLIVGLFDQGALHNFGGFSFQLIFQIVRDNHLVWPFASLVVSHLISFGWDYLWNGEFRRTNPMELMTQPYRRVVIMHITVIIGGFLMMALHLPEAALIFLVVLKTSTDLWGHQAEREKLVADKNASSAMPSLAVRPSVQNVLQQALQARARQSDPASREEKKQFFIILGVVLVIGIIFIGCMGYFVYDFVRPFVNPSRHLPAKPAAAATVVNSPFWKPALAGVPFPETPAKGKFRGADFSVTHAVYANGKLSLRDGSGTNNPNIVITLNLETNKLPGASYEFSAGGASGILDIRMYWREKGAKRSVFRSFTGGYSLKLNFSDRIKNNIPAKIYLCLPDADKSCVAGTFTAAIKKEKAPPPPTDN